MTMRYFDAPPGVTVRNRGTGWPSSSIFSSATSATVGSRRTSPMSKMETVYTPAASPSVECSGTGPCSSAMSKAPFRRRSYTTGSDGSSAWNRIAPNGTASGGSIVPEIAIRLRGVSQPLSRSQLASRSGQTPSVGEPGANPTPWRPWRKTCSSASTPFSMSAS